MLNGDGLRVVLWVSGCTHCCKECHNPITWDPNGGLDFTEDVKQELFNELKKDYISGITFSGGDPLHGNNVLEITEIAQEIRQRFPTKTIWLYTGSLWETVKEMEIAQYIDVLVDGEFERDLYDANLHWKGSANQRVIQVPISLEKGEIYEKNCKIL